MARRASRVDANHPDTVQDLRKMGVSVLSLHEVGMGAPDILCSWRGLNFLFEIKDPEKPPSKRKLNPMQERWHEDWQGQVDMIHSAEEAMEIMRQHLKG